MFTKLWRKFRASHDDHERRKDEATLDEFARQREEHERTKGGEPDLPPGRSGTDWTYVPPN